MSADARLVRRLGDRLLLDAVDAAVAEAGRRAASWCACRVGCTECCRGPFPINALDASRLREGLSALRGIDPGRADAVRARARRAAAAMADAFPGDPDTGELAGDEQAEQAFWERFASTPCPALDGETGACDLYESRPVSCRTYGPPIRFGDQVLPPCRLWFAGAPAGAVEQARVEPDPEDRERELLEMEVEGSRGDTIVAFALLQDD
jgi:Fe-S-cluster containining protein